MLTAVLSMFSIESILAWLARKAGLVGALSLLRFKQLTADNPGIIARFEKLQTEAALTMPHASGVDKAKWVVESVLAEMHEIGNDALTSLLYGLNGAIFFENKALPVAAQPELPPVNMPIS